MVRQNDGTWKTGNIQDLSSPPTVVVDDEDEAKQYDQIRAIRTKNPLPTYTILMEQAARLVLSIVSMIIVKDTDMSVMIILSVLIFINILSAGLSKGGPFFRHSRHIYKS